MEWKDFEVVLRDVWRGEYPRWRAKHIDVGRLSEIHPNLGSITGGDAIFGQALNRHIGFGNTQESFYANDLLNRNYFRVGYTNDYFRLGRLGWPGIRYEDGAVVTDGETLRDNSVTYNKMLLDSMQYNFLHTGELIQGDSSVYQTCELHGLGLTAMGITNQPPAESADVLNDWAGIQFQPVMHFPPDTYEYETSSIWKLAFAAYGPTLWVPDAGAMLSMANLTTLKTLAEYRAQGWQLWSNEDEMDSFACYVDRSGDNLRATVLYHEGGGGTDTKMEWTSTGWTVLYDEVQMFAVDQNGITIRDYLAFDPASVEPGSPPVGALWYDRANDRYVFRNAAGNTRKLTDEAI